MEGFPRCSLGCCAVDVGDVEVRSWFGDLSRDGEDVFRVSYELVLSCDPFMDEEGTVLGFVWACEDSGDGVAYSRCPGDAEWDVASVDDCRQPC